MSLAKNEKSQSPDAGSLSGYYGRVDEEARLAVGTGPLELARIREILGRFLPSPPAAIGDVGGGEEEPSLMGTSSHILAVARKQK